MSEREVEIPWAVRNAVAPCLDVGSAESTYLGDLDGPVDGIDVRITDTTLLRNAYLGDIREFAFSDTYQTVLAISTLEHVGLAHEPYGTTDDEVIGGDERAVQGCWSAVAPGGKLLISVPFGAQRNYGWFRQYDLEGLASLMGPLLFTAEIWVHTASGWKEVEDLDYIDQVEQMEYDFDRRSASAVALITVEKNEA